MKAAALLKHALCVLTFLVGFSAFVVMAGEEVPGAPLELFLLTKLMASLVLWLSFMFGKFCVRHNLFPEGLINDMGRDDIEGEGDYGHDN